MDTGYLKIQAKAGEDALPIGGAQVTVKDNEGRILHTALTNDSGFTEIFSLSAPNVRFTLDPDFNRPAYSTYNVEVRKPGYQTEHISGVEIVDTQTAILPVEMRPLYEGGETDNFIDLDPLGILIPGRYSKATPPPIAQPTTVSAYQIPNVTDPRRLPIPEFITVHLGVPTNTAARNVRVRFPDYIKNVTSSEIYSTWPRNSLYANIYAIITFALNRIYTEWYRSRGYNFDITNSTRYDQAYREGGPVFENISRIVDEVFNTFAHRQGFVNPFFTQFCNGTTATCPGLSQWGTVTLANQGRSPLDILRYYYPRDLILTTSSNIGGIVESFPGTALRRGSTGESVRHMQNFLNRIRVNYPAIPRISNPNGVFGVDTENSVKTFQRIFNLTQDGIVGRATWNYIVRIFVAITRLAELDSEGVRIDIGANPPNVTLSLNSRGSNVLQLQFILNTLANHYSSVPYVIMDSVFDNVTRNSVIEFQRNFGLRADGIVGPNTWNKLYEVFRGVRQNVNVPQPPPTPPTSPNIPFPGTLLRLGSRGDSVRLMQSYLNTIRVVFGSIPLLTVDGVFGPMTENAVRIFQNMFGLVGDGIIGPITWGKIVEQYNLVTGNAGAQHVYPGVPLREGSRGDSVRLMQQYLIELSGAFSDIPRITADGIFGPRTREAVIAFQRRFGLVQDGIIGPITWFSIINQRNALR
jgi:peptidoglycan hydrolase-like protein with peptidoglycan-binding domain